MMDKRMNVNNSFVSIETERRFYESAFPTEYIPILNTIASVEQKIIAE